MSGYYTIFDAESGVALRSFFTTKLDQVARQALAAHEIIVEGEYDEGAAILGIDGRTRYMPVPKALPAVAPIVTVAEVKDHAARMLRSTDWQMLRAWERGELPPAELAAEREAIRAASNRIEAMSPIPTNFRDPSYWS